MSHTIFFRNYKDALLFLKKIRVGKVISRSSDNGFLWESDSKSLTDDQHEIIAEEIGTKYVWLDQDTGLSWLIKKGIDSNHIKLFNESSYGGYSDWRTPSLRELKTLASTVKNRFGVFAKEAIGDRLQGNFASCTTHVHWQDKAWWNFDLGESTTEKYSDGKTIWSSEGEFAGFEKSVHHNYAQLILVRGATNESLSEWALTLREWAETDNVFDFPSTQENMEKIEELTLFFSKRLPVEISQLTNLKRLDCYSYAKFEEAIFSIASLEQLKLHKPHGSEPYLKEIPSAIAKLTRLVSLNASFIGLNKVHEAIGGLTKLQHLDLSGNDLELIPYSILNLGDLKTLRLAGLRCLPKSVEKLTQLESLKISGSFECIPDCIEELVSLCDLSISSENLAHLSHNLYKLRHLRTLNIYKSNLEVFPGALLEMQFLKTLILKDAPITKIPEDICKMVNLEHLDLGGTAISEIPESLIHLDKLRFLNLSYTRLETLPEWLNDMQSLTRIAANELEFPLPLRKKRAYISN